MIIRLYMTKMEKPFMTMGTAKVNGATRSYAVYENPVGNLQQDKSQTTSNVTNINLGLNYEIIKGLDFTYNFGAYLENIKIYSLEIQLEAQLQ